MSVTIAFRLDDPSPTSDHAIERRILALFAQHRVPLTVAVVPYAVVRGTGETVAASPDTLPHLAETLAAGDIELALHGHTHLDRAPAGLGPSECRGVPHEVQYTLFRAGKECLSSAFSVAIDGFVPPWNTFDDNTLRVAADCGFTYLSAGDVSAPPGTSLASVARTCRLDRLASALQEAARYADCDPVIVVVLHPDNFVEFRAPPDAGEEGPITDLATLDTLLGAVANATPVAQRLTLGGLVAARRERPLWSRRDPGWLGRLPDRITMRLPRYLAFSGSRAQVLWRAMQRERSR